MLANLTEIVLVVIIILVVFGVGKLPSIATYLGRIRAQFKRGLEEEEPIDITPDEQKRGGAPPTRKPGRFDTSAEDAQIDEA